MEFLGGISHKMFQSRNRDTFLFKVWRVVDSDDTSPEFQSRNRDTFLFKLHSDTGRVKNDTSFQSRNRDTFLFKREVRAHIAWQDKAFQSRNRDTFLFKLGAARWDQHGITVSISQSRYFSFQDAALCEYYRLYLRFNLAIEILFFSRTHVVNLEIVRRRAFQSRNRDTFLFK